VTGGTQENAPHPYFGPKGEGKIPKTEILAGERFEKLGAFKSALKLALDP
jgi:hypothetical protein